MSVSVSVHVYSTFHVQLNLGRLSINSLNSRDANLIRIRIRLTLRINRPLWSRRDWMKEGTDEGEVIGDLGMCSEDGKTDGAGREGKCSEIRQQGTEY